MQKNIQFFGFLIILLCENPVFAIFGPQDAQYNETEARMLLNLCAAAYSDDATPCIGR